MTEEKSELEVLLEKNAYGSGLTREEQNRAVELIVNAEITEKGCWICEMYDRDISQEENKAIYDTGVCRGHAHYALSTRK